MLGLLESIGRSRADVAIRIIALDDERFFDEGVDRSAELVDRIVVLRRQSGDDAVVVVLGNYHARPIAPINARVDGVRPTVPPLPTAARIRDIPLQTVDVSACGGEFWTCRSSSEPCGAVELPAGCEAESASRLLELDPQRAGYHLRIIVPRLTPSPPAR